MSPMPAQKPGRSVQDYQTPPEFLTAVRTRLKIEAFALDVAADEFNTVADSYYTIVEDALQQSWACPGWAWCNPPFANLAPWVEKGRAEGHAGWNSAMLVPAAVGANWWRDFVHEQAHVSFVNGRLTFVGQKDCYPKDCALLFWGPRLHDLEPGGRAYDVWDWRRTGHSRAWRGR